MDNRVDQRQDIEQSTYSGMDLRLTQQNNVQQCYNENFTCASALSPSNDRPVLSGDNPYFNLLDYLMDSESDPRRCNTRGNTSDFQPQPPAKYPRTHEPSQPFQSTRSNSGDTDNPSPATVHSSSINSLSCQTWPCLDLDQNFFQTISPPNIDTPQSPVADNTVTKLSQCPDTTNPGFGPNEFNLSISLSPWDVPNTEKIEWLYVDKTGAELTLNFKTSFVLEQLYKTYSALNSSVTCRMRLPETGREYQIRLKDMEMIDVSSGEKIALFRKFRISDLQQQ